MFETRNFYWKPTKKGFNKITWMRMQTIITIVGNTTRTVRNIAYKLYPKLHGKSLDNAYNMTIKDLVRLRMNHILDMDLIKEVRTTVNDVEGYRDVEDFLRYREVDALDLRYKRSRRPAHKHPMEVWFEKETVIDIFEEVCNEYDIPTLPVRGKPQVSTIAKGAVRLTPDHHILYFGDNDKIGREDIFGTCRDYVTYLNPDIPASAFHWCGVTNDQEKRFGLPKNARLDGLDTDDLVTIIKEAIEPYIDRTKLKNIVEQEKKDKEYLKGFKLVLVKK
jgi:hypothetical protein